MTSLSKNARVAGVFYVLFSAVGVVRLLYIPSTLIVHGNRISDRQQLSRATSRYSDLVLSATRSAALYGFLSRWLFILSDHLKTGQRRSGQNRPTRAAGTGLFYSADSFGGKFVFVRQLRGPHLSTCP